MNPDTLNSVLPTLLGIAVLMPLASFALILFVGPRLGKHGFLASYVATGAILSCFVLSFISLCCWLSANGYPAGEHHGDHHASVQAKYPLDVRPVAHRAAPEHEHPGGDEHVADGHASDMHAANHSHGVSAPKAVTGDWWLVAQFGELRLSIGYYIDSLTICMFVMVTFIASCIHFYAIGYMHDELHDITDHEVTLSDGHHLHRPGRFHRFFQYLSLFCFSMLGLVVAGSVAMTFVFWELVGICSYFLIGFYIERKSASNAANKAFITNRVGDFGMIIGLMALWGSLGTLNYGDIDSNADGKLAASERGLFSQVRPEGKLVVPPGMVLSAIGNDVQQILDDHDNPADAASEIESRTATASAAGAGYWLLIVGGLGIFCGCVGKSAQFPLHVWLPDAMEGPTPVSALVHSATMVAAGVFLVGRFYPVFTSEVLLVIAIIGCITLFLAATIAITATDIKRVLAYSTVSQLGYMMLGLGVGGWLAGLLHLFTHAFFKSLLFMCSGSVIHACHTNEMTKMGGLRHKMPWTAYTMLVGCLAIIGAGIPFTIFGHHLGLSGFYSKDAILAQASVFADKNPLFAWLFYAAAGGAAMTAFYMFRLWFMTFAGRPRDHHVYDHAHESPKVMYLPLVVLAVMAVIAAWPVPFSDELSLRSLLSQSQVQGPTASASDVLGSGIVLSKESDPAVHAAHGPITWLAFGTAMSGVLLAAAFYGLNWLNPDEVRQQFSKVYAFLRNKWYFDELYNAIFIRPTHFVSKLAAAFDKNVIDRFIDLLASWVRLVARIDDLIDRYLVDGIVNSLARWTYGVGLSLRGLQTGKLRQYVVFIVVGTVAMYVLASFLLSWGKPVSLR